MVKTTKDVAPQAAEEHVGGGHIAVTAQQSRYALDAVDAPASKEVYIHGIKNGFAAHVSRYSSRTFPSRSETEN